MADEIPKRYDFNSYETSIYRRWTQEDAFAALPGAGGAPYVIMMPLPNVTGALHMGHAMDNVMQDLLVRWHRMQGENTLWMPGTDHAGIATQAVVEKRLFELEGKTRHDIGRDALVEKIWTWKDEYQERIVRQQQQMGCSCDWGRARFTMDRVCARAVREAFFRLFRDGLIYRGNRLVNWDCQLQTAVSDDEIVYEKVQGFFWHIRYPVADPRPGEPGHVTVATTRPETMLGDTAVAVHPDPAGELERIEALLRGRIEGAPKRERALLEQELERIRARRRDLLPHLLQLKRMAEEKREVILPLLNRGIPLILDEWAKPDMGSGCVKITPAHDPNDYEVWRRHREEIGLINILQSDGSLNREAGPYAGMDRFAARDKVVADLRDLGLLERTEDREIEIGHSDRSKTPIEPYLSRQWFVRMGDIPGGIGCGEGTGKRFRTSGLAQAAIEAVDPGWRSPSGRNLTFHPDPVRYGGTYRAWLQEKRDWCISRQLWWGHRIPIWHCSRKAEDLADVLDRMPDQGRDLHVWLTDPEGRLFKPDPEQIAELDPAAAYDILACPRDEAAAERLAQSLTEAGLEQDPDVLDTWFSSALWPFSTLGWPDPAGAEVDPGQRPLGPEAGNPDSLSFYYPGSCLVTARDIITLWVARMQVMGLYLLGDVPFTDCFIHANIQDGKGERMSKSKGNGIDPADIIERYGADAMRYVLCDMQTGTQDIRLPVQAESPYTGKLVDLAEARHGRTVFTYICPESGKEFDVLGTMPDLPMAKIISDRFDVGRAFCTKLWNAARFALMNLGEFEFRPLEPGDLAEEDRWILSRLSRVIETVSGQLAAYNPSAAIGAAREFFWSELCDWYLEFVKPRFRDSAAAPAARSVLAFALDQVLRLLHPFVPFITEVLWERLNAQCPVRGLEAPLPGSPLLIGAAWPEPLPERQDRKIERDFALAQDIIRAVRDLRARYRISPGRALEATIKAAGPTAATLEKLAPLIRHIAHLTSLTVSGETRRPADAAVQVVGDLELFLAGVVDTGKEKERLEKQRDKLLHDIQRARQRLENENFVSRAPEAVVAAERGKLDEYLAQLQRLEESLAAVADVS
jgi:valyl-tRNA synthetase